MAAMHEDDSPDLREVAKILEETLDVRFFLLICMHTRGHNFDPLGYE